jgi:xanthosine utilization system XapX-like protein
MNLFDKICACLACILGGLFIILGVMGLFMGCNANFTLPPILGGRPALVGWSIIKPVIVAWKKPAARPDNAHQTSDQTPTFQP